MTKESTREAIGQVAVDHHHDVADRFNQYYEASPDRFANAFRYGRHKVDNLLDECLKGLEPGAKILDVGCGTGHYVVRLRDLGFDGHGMEPADAMRKRAIEINPPDKIKSGVITALPYEDDTFDLVLSIEVFRYLHRDDVLQGMREVMRVLKPGGTAFLTFVNRYALDGFYLLQKARQLVRSQDFDVKHPHCEFTSPAEVQADLRGAGASSVRIEGRLFGPMRLVYKASEALGSTVAKVVEPYDDMLHENRMLAPVAGHLIAIATK